MYNKILITIMVVSQFAFNIQAQSSKPFSVTPYIKIGYLLAAPSANDLGYEEVSGGSVEEFQDLDEMNYGGGIQFFFGMNKTLKFGLDVGYQKLFSSKFELPASYPTYSDYHYDDEQDLYLLGLAEFNLSGTPIFFQAGGGMHLVFWQWEYHYSGYYGSEDEEESDSAINFGLSAVIGANIPIGNMSIPVFVRVDQIFRYDSIITGSAGIGLTF